MRVSHVKWVTEGSGRTHGERCGLLPMEMEMSTTLEHCRLWESLLAKWVLCLFYLFYWHVILYSNMHKIIFVVTISLAFIIACGQILVADPFLNYYYFNLVVTTYRRPAGCRLRVCSAINVHRLYSCNPFHLWITLLSFTINTLPFSSWCSRHFWWSSVITGEQTTGFKWKLQ